MTGWFPHPLMALSLFLLWLLLQGSASLGSLLLGAVIAIAGSRIVVALRLPRGQIRRISILPALFWNVLIEIVRSNAAVARIILQPIKARSFNSGFVLIPLDMRSPYGLAALACILTATPGTVWVDYDAEESTMLLHVLDLVDEETWIRTVKDRWERQLMEIFE